MDTVTILAWPREWLLLSAVVVLSTLSCLLLLQNRRQAAALRRSEASQQRRNQMIEGLKAGVFQLTHRAGQEPRVLFANDTFKKWVRASTGEPPEFFESAFFECIAEADREKITRTIRWCLETGENFRESFQFLFPNGLVGCLVAEARCQQNDDGSRIWSGYFFDLSIEHTLLEQLNLSKTERDTFVIAAGHELRTPLQNLSLTLESFEEGSVAGQNAQRLLAARAAAADLEALVEDFMEISSLNATEAVLKVDCYDFHELINQVCHSFYETSRSHRLGYYYDIDSSIPETAWGDSLRIKQVLYNIIGNAFKYTDAGEVSVYVSLAPDFSIKDKTHTSGELLPAPVAYSVSSESKTVYTQWILISVSDTGIGIASSELPHIFEPFSTVGPASSDSRGLGLAICARLVKLMGGRIVVDSKTQEGTTFTVYIPLTVEKPVDSKPSNPIETPLMDSVARRHNVVEQFDMQSIEFDETRRIDHDPIEPCLAANNRLDVESNTLLVVDDNRMVREMLSSLLSLNGWHVLQADSGTEALALIEQFDCRAVITDYKMPNMTGLELGYALMKHYQDKDYRPVLIIMSGAMSSEQTSEANRLFDFVQVKPVKSAEIHSSIVSKSNAPVFMRSRIS